MTEPEPADLRTLQTFVVQLGAAMNEAGEPVYSVQDRLTRVVTAFGAHGARISAFPTFMMVTMAGGEPATLENTSGVVGAPRLDQIAELDRLVQDAEDGHVSPGDGLRRLAEIRAMKPRFGPAHSIVGYAVFTMGLCLILQPSPRDVVAAAVLGGVVGLLRSLGQNNRPLEILMPILAAFCVATLGALTVRYEMTGPGLRAMVASLVVFIPGAALTTAVLELAAGQMVSGASRLVAGIMQLALLAFGIIAGIEVVGVPVAAVFRESDHLLGAWAPWLGVLIFAVGVLVANSAPVKAFPGLLVVLYAAWAGQVFGNAVFGAYVSAFVGAVVMTPVAVWVSRMPSAMPPHASFLPGFWLLVPGALGLIGLAQLAGNPAKAGAQDLINTIVSIFAVAVGVLCGTLLVGWASATGRMVGGVSARVEHNPLLMRLRTRTGNHPES